MLRNTVLRENKDEIIERLEKRCNSEYADLVNRALELDKKKRQIQMETDGLLAEMNKASKQIGTLMKEGKREEAEEAKAKVAQIKSKAQ